MPLGLLPAPDHADTAAECARIPAQAPLGVDGEASEAPAVFWAPEA